MPKPTYSVDGYQFDLEAFFPMALFEKITEIRVNAPEVIEQQAKARKKRKHLTRDGRPTTPAGASPPWAMTRSGWATATNTSGESCGC